MGEGRKVYNVLVKSSKENDHSEDQGVEGRMGSKWLLGILAGRVWSVFTCLRMRTSGRLL
jgi:hypothetical protein